MLLLLASGQWLALTRLAGELCLASPRPDPSPSPTTPARLPRPAPLHPRSKERLDRVQELRWTHRSLPEHVKPNLSTLEHQYFRQYDKLLNK